MWCLCDEATRPNSRWNQRGEGPQTAAAFRCKAMARKLLIALWRYVETGVTLDGVEFRAEADVTV
jgi:hypothetical protein